MSAITVKVVYSLLDYPEGWKLTQANYIHYSIYHQQPVLMPRVQKAEADPERRFTG
jgi:hypothetical protein